MSFLDIPERFKQDKKVLVNLYGSAGSGKSTTAMGLVWKLRMLGYAAEYVDEYAKHLFYQGRLKTAKQSEIFLIQAGKILDYMKSNAQFIVTDSPPYLSLFYGSIYKGDENDLMRVYDDCKVYHSMVVEEGYKDLSIYLDRCHPYQKMGRSQNEERAKENDDLLYQMVKSGAIKQFTGEYIHKIKTSPNTVEDILEVLLDRRWV